MFATKIKMKTSSGKSNDLLEIDQVHINGNVYFTTGWYTKAFLYDYLKANPDSIQVNLQPFPNIIPALSEKGEKFIKSAPDKTEKDNLLNLVRV